LASLIAAPVLAACAGPGRSTHAVSRSKRATTTTVAATWSPLLTVSHGTPLGAVDCPTTTFCLAVGDDGDVFRFDGSAWTPAGTTGIGATGSPSLSCTGPTFCSVVVQGANQATIWNGSAFGQADTLPAQGLDAVGCATTTFCVTVDSVGDAFYYDGSSWSNGANDWGSIAAVSCPNTTFCVSVGTGISVWNGQSWTQPQPFGLTSNLTSVLCPEVTSCQAVDDTGQVETWNGTAWSGPQQAPIPASSPGGSFSAVADPVGISCGTSTFCVVVNAGSAVAWTGASWSTHVADRGSVLNAVSCVTATFCVAVDQRGDATVYR
jgi:hypothetical protein